MLVAAAVSACGSAAMLAGLVVPRLCSGRLTRPRFDRPSTAAVLPASAAGSRAARVAAKNVPALERKLAKLVPKARPIAVELPVTLTSVRLRETELTRSAFAAAKRRAARTVAAEGAKRRLNSLAVSVPA